MRKTQEEEEEEEEEEREGNTIQTNKSLPCVVQ